MRDPFVRDVGRHSSQHQETSASYSRSASGHGSMWPRPELRGVLKAGKAALRGWSYFLLCASRRRERMRADVAIDGGLSDCLCKLVKVLNFSGTFLQRELQIGSWPSSILSMASSISFVRFARQDR